MKARRLETLTALALAAALCLGALPGAALAAPPDPEIREEAEVSAPGETEAPEETEIPEETEEEGSPRNPQISWGEEEETLDDSSRAADRGVLPGSSIRWELSGGTLTISGSGPMPDIPAYDPPWDKSGVLYLTVEEGVTTIGPYAFFYCKNLRTADLPEGLEVIGAEAFDGCESLTRADLPSTLEEIGNFAFANCGRLKKAVIPASCAVVGNYAFQSCGSLAELTVSEGVEVLGAYAFERCAALTSVTLPSTLRDARGVGTKDGGTFYRCTGLEEVVIREGASGLGKNMFWLCGSLKRASVPSTAQVADRMFWECGSLTDVDIAEGVTSVGEGAFYQCPALEEITLPDTLEELGEWAFNDCRSLREIAVPGGVTAIEKETFTNCVSLERFSLGEAPWRKTQSIGRNAFWGCKNLEHVSFWYSLKTVGVNAFYDCPSLWTADFHGSSDEWDELIAYLDKGNESLAAVTVSLLPVPTARPALLDKNGEEVRTLEDAAGRTLDVVLDFHGDGGESAAWTAAACYDGEGRMTGLVRLETDATRVQDCARGELEVPPGTAEVKFLLTDGDSEPLAFARSLLRGRTGLT